MITSKEAKELSSYKCENKSVDELLENIEHYIKLSAQQLRTHILYSVDFSLYTPKTIKAVIKTLKKNGYKIKIWKTKYTEEKNEPISFCIEIKWW